MLTIIEIEYSELYDNAVINKRSFYSLLPFAVKLSDRIEPRIVASIWMGSDGVRTFPITFLNEKTTLEFIIAILILLGFVFALFPNTNAVMSSAEKRFYGVTSGILETMLSQIYRKHTTYNRRVTRLCPKAIPMCPVWNHGEKQKNIICKQCKLRMPKNQ